MKNFLLKIRQKLSDFWRFLRKNFLNIRELESIIQTFLTNLIMDETIAHSLNVVANGDFSRVTLLAVATSLGRTFLKAAWNVVRDQIVNQKIISSSDQTNNL